MFQNYIPLKLDILHARRATKGINEHQIYIKGIPFLFIDVGGQRVTAPEVVSVFRGHHVHPVSGVVERVRPGPHGGPQNEQTGRVLQYIRDDHQQQIIQQRVHHPLPQQNGLTRGEGQTRQHQGLHAQLHRRPAQHRGREGVPVTELRFPPQGARQAPLPPLHHGHRHGEHQTRVSGRQGHDTPRKPAVLDASVTLDQPVLSVL